MQIAEKDIETNNVKKECYLIREDNTICTFSVFKICFKYRTRQIKATETNKLVTYRNSNGSLTKIM